MISDPTITRMAAELAPALEAAIEGYIDTGMIMGSPEYHRLDGLLWDNKVGILRVLQAQAKE